MVGVWIWMLRGWSWAPVRQICRNRSLEFPGGLAEPWNTCEEQPLHLQWNDEWKRIGRLWLQRKQFVFWMSATAKETAKAFPPSPGSVVFEFSLADAVLHGSVQWLQSLWLLSYVNKIKLAYFRPCSFHLCHKRPLGPLLSRKTLEKSLNIQQHNESSEVWFRLRIEVAFFSFGGQSFLITWKHKTKQSIWLAHLHCALLAPIGFTAGAQGKFRPLDRE